MTIIDVRMIEREKRKKSGSKFGADGVTSDVIQSLTTALRKQNQYVLYDCMDVWLIHCYHQ